MVRDTTAASTCFEIISVETNFNLGAHLKARFSDFLHFISVPGIYLSYKTPSSQRGCFEMHVQPTVNVTAHCNTLAAVKRQKNCILLIG